MLTTTFGFPVSMVLVDVFVSRERETDRQRRGGKGREFFYFFMILKRISLK